ncbi:MAG: quinate 5-dehydrogenase [Armatimonadetes bacterium]|nr:quinate 5-dehydrogenase [Armatimonadota bacterium]
MRRIVSVSLGSSKGDKVFETEILGERFRIERIGTDGDRKRFSSLFGELDGKVDALGVGGADIYVVAAGRRYAFREIQRLVSGARVTPVVDGSGLKHTLERETIRRLAADGIVDFSQERVLLVSAVDRYGMAEALSKVCPNVIYGDALFALGLPWRIRSYRTIQVVGALLLPIVVRLPFQWFYPTGEKQEKRTPKFADVFEWATWIAGDKHYIRRYAPDRLDGKTVLTQSIRRHDLEWLRGSGVRRLVTTTPEMGGETFATNVMEGVVVALCGKRPEQMTESDYLSVLDRLGWRPSVFNLTEGASG